MKDRIQLLVKVMNYTAAQFAEEIGVQKSGMSHILSGRNNPSLDFVQKILLRFPEINTEWLMFGKGKMFHENSNIVESPINKEIEGKIKPSELVLDLFSEIESKHSPKYSIPEPLTHEINKSVEVSNNNDVENVQTNQERDNHPIREVEKKSNMQSKTIEKVLIFYSDNTFKEYKPE